jgi:predicted amidohydrolase
MNSELHEGEMKIGVYQFAPEFGNIRANLDKIEETIDGADADLIVLPELCTTGYQFVSTDEIRSLAEPIQDGETVRRLESLCRKNRFHLVAGFAESACGDIYNSSALIGPEGLIGSYRKVHLFREEKLWFKPGNQGFGVWNVGSARVGMMICFDWIYPESARTLALAGADILCHPSNLVLPYCPDAMITRSIENRVFSVTANRDGSEARGGKSGLTFIGRSEVVGVKGEILFRLGDREEVLRIVEIDPCLARDKQVTEMNDLFEDRRPEAYHPDRRC